ncbi:putative F-box protein At1g46840 [Papaver somniferum]|uniref:putative F-box protein At1g46840 n=1 Tax=Papaver somniferum TaxID=3469 RepID=UPI000E7022B2|nr:putative F-box protein At1g46840 [Papaver somniferum]
MEDLHISIMSEILYRVPLEFVVSCKLVSKKWNDILSQRKVAGILFLVGSYWERNFQLYYGNLSDILKTSDPEQFSYKKFIKMNHPLVNRREFAHPENFFVGSRNGLVCFSVPHHCINDPVYITNPISGEYVNLPRLHPKRGLVISGFGYLRSSNEYKVVRIFYPDKEKNSYSNNNAGVGWVQIYTLGVRVMVGETSVSSPTNCFMRVPFLMDPCTGWKDPKGRFWLLFLLMRSSE